MRKIVLAIAIIFVSFSAVAAEKLSETEKLEKGWIVQSVNGDSLVTLEVKALVNAPVEKVWELFKEVHAWKNWMTMLNIAKGVNIKGHPKKDEATFGEAVDASPVPLLIKSNGKTMATVFEEYDLPWPINNDWVIRDYTFDETEAEEGVYRVSFRPIFEGVEKERGGKYMLKRHKGRENETYLEYKIVVKRKESVPQAVFNIILGETADRMVRSIRRNTESLGTRTFRYVSPNYVLAFKGEIGHKIPTSLKISARSSAG